MISFILPSSNATSRALKRLPVKQESCLKKQSQRLLLFHAAKTTLHRGMQLLGLRPLDQM